MPKVNSYSAKGVKGTFELPKESVGKENLALLAQAVRVYEDRGHKGTSRVKTRSEVQASGAKIYRQKGTGNARHGDVKAPIFVGGGKAHGPKGIKRVLELSSRLRRESMRAALTLKIKENRLVTAKGLDSLQKTKEATDFLNSVYAKELDSKIPSTTTIVFSAKNQKTKRIFRNLKNVDVLLFNSINARDIFYGGFVIFDQDHFEKSALVKEKSTHPSEKPEKMAKSKVSNKGKAKKVTKKKTK